MIGGVLRFFAAYQNSKKNNHSLIMPLIECCKTVPWDIFVMTGSWFKYMVNTINHDF